MTSLQGKGCYTWRQVKKNWNEMVDVKCRQMDEAGTLETTNWMVLSRRSITALSHRSVS